jgi:hypothetical protein
MSGLGFELDAIAFFGGGGNVRAGGRAQRSGHVVHCAAPGAGKSPDPGGGRANEATHSCRRHRRSCIDDLDRVATAAYMTGRDEHGSSLWTRAHQRCVTEGSLHRAAAFGAKLAQALGFKGDWSRCSGWTKRVANLLEQAVSPPSWARRCCELAPDGRAVR